MFKKLKSLFTRNKTKAEIKPSDIRIQIGERVYPILEEAFRRNRLPPKDISTEDWSYIKERILWSFSALRTQKKPFNNTKAAHEEQRIKDGLILFANHIDNLKL